MKNLCKIDFKELKELNLSFNKISDIKALEKVKFGKLEKLYLSWNEISDISILKKVNFKNLKELYLNSNQISDIRVFENVKFEKLEILNLDNNKISDVNILAKINCKKKTFSFQNKQIENNFLNNNYNILSNTMLGFQYQIYPNGWMSIYKQNSFYQNNFMLNNMSKGKTNIIFKTTRGTALNIIIDYEKTVRELIQLYFKRLGKPELYDRPSDIYFLFNANRLNYSDQTSVKKFFSSASYPMIMVNDLRDLIGALINKQL